MFRNFKLELTVGKQTVYQLQIKNKQKSHHLRRISREGRNVGKRSSKLKVNRYRKEEGGTQEYLSR